MTVEMMLAAAAAVSAGAFLKSPAFGARPAGARLEVIRRSPNYRDGGFRNEPDKPAQVTGDCPGVSGPSKPPGPVPVMNTEFASIGRDRDYVAWLGHSSLYIQLDGVRILVDPVFHSYASPVFFINRSFAGSDAFTAGDFEPDLIILTHDHYDHLDRKTLLDLKAGGARVICPLGVGGHLERWGYGPSLITETDWWQESAVSRLTVHTLPSHHFSGRTLARNETLWASYLIRGGTKSLYLSGDTGYGPHFEEIGRRFGGVDLAVMEGGQYNRKMWPGIHLLPECCLAGALELHAKRVLPVHSGKFKLSVHAWNEPYEVLSGLFAESGVKLLTPMIGQAVFLDCDEDFGPWWRSVTKPEGRLAAMRHRPLGGGHETGE